MYRSDLNPRDRSGAILAVVAIHAALLFALMHASGRIDLTDPQSALRVFDVTEVPPPPPAEPLVERRREEREKPKEAEGAASPENIRSQATPIADPKPRIALPLPVPVAVSETPKVGTQATQGAAEVRGPGTGAGGTGTGTGSGGSGSGTGGGGSGGVAVPVQLVRGITNRDYPPELQRRWPAGGRIYLRLRIEPNGSPSRCDVMRSYGDPIADQWTCRLVMDRGQFRPARDRQGQPVSAWFGYVQSDRGPGGR